MAANLAQSYRGQNPQHYRTICQIGAQQIGGTKYWNKLARPRAVTSYILQDISKTTTKMFVLSTFHDTIRVPPKHLGSPIEDVLADELNLRLANKVVLNVGLIICLRDIVDVGESHIFNGDGAIHTKCTFRMIVFRPQIGEVLCGTLRSSSKEGLNISLGFFDSIVVPPQQLNEPSQFNELDQTWTWNFEDDGQTHVLRLEVGEQVRFRVHSEKFVDVSPHGPSGMAAGNTPAIQIAKSELDKKEVPYTIVGSICESGLGLVKWWQ